MRSNVAPGAVALEGEEIPERRASGRVVAEPGRSRVGVRVARRIVERDVDHETRTPRASGFGGRDLAGESVRQPVAPADHPQPHAVVGEAANVAPQILA
jgi:hypothetical protein